MGQVSEIFQAPLPGTYPVVIIAAEAGVSGKGNSQIVLTNEIVEGRYKGEQFLDWVGTDPTAKGAGIGRGKLRILLKGTQFDGLADAGAENEVPDAVIAQGLVGRRYFAVIDNSPRKRKDEQGNRTNENMTQLDPATGQLITIMNADVKGYTLHAVTTQTAAPQLQQQSFTQPQQGQPQYAASTPAPQAGSATPSGLPFQPNFNPGTATPPWAAQGNGAQGAQEPAKRGGKKLPPIQDQQG